MSLANDADDPYCCDYYLTNAFGTSGVIIYIRKEYRDYDITMREIHQAELMTEAWDIVNSLKSKNKEDMIIEIGKKIAARAEYDRSLNERIKFDKSLLNAEMNVERGAYGCLVMGKTVCSGYAKAFKLVCDLAGIECWVIDGEVKEPHEWNIVCSDEYWYYADVTGADTSGDKKFYKFGEDLYRENGYVMDPNFVHPYSY